jgi:gamma-glutamyltranspeptidase
VLYESRLDPALVESLRRRGHQVRSVPALGHVNAFYCPKGLRANSASCQVANDPRGFSLASVVQ